MSEAKSLGEMVLYQAADGGPALEVRLARDTVWLSQAQMVDLFERDQSVVSRHLRNVFAEGELDAGSNMRKMHIAGSTKPTAFYNLDVIIAVGYRVKSKRGTQFRIWATRVLREHLVRGYTVNERRLPDQPEEPLSDRAVFGAAAANRTRDWKSARFLGYNRDVPASDRRRRRPRGGAAMVSAAREKIPALLALCSRRGVRRLSVFSGLPRGTADPAQFLHPRASRGHARGRLWRLSRPGPTSTTSRRRAG